MTSSSWFVDRRLLKLSGSPVLEGASEDEKLVGKRSDDLIEAGGGDDIVDGRSGNDTLTGGSGADFFVLSPGDDVITDFNPAEGDRLVFKSTDEVVITPEEGGALVASSGGVNTFIEGGSAELLKLVSIQRLKPEFGATFEDGTTFKMESASSPQSQSLGMMQRERLRPRRGMMFPQDEKVSGSVFMFNCIAPLDLVFLSEGEIVDLSVDTPICAEQDPGACPTYESRQPFDNWLEFRVGTIDKFGLAIGQSVEISPL